MKESFAGSGYVYIDASGVTWWQSDKPGVMREELADADSVCGAGIFETKADDPFKVACEFHDHCFNNRAWYEYMGITFEQVNHIFYRMMRDIAGGDIELQARALGYFLIVSGSIGLHYWNRHPAYDGKTIPPLPVT